MQGDWWLSNNFALSKDSQQSSDQTAWDSAVATPSVVTLTVHPVTDTNPYSSGNRSGTGPLASGTPPRHWPCNRSTALPLPLGVASSTSQLILAAQRRKRLHFNQQKAQTNIDQ
nr:uncharacterized protein LOC129281088 [Lytechinus pictus]